MNTITIDQLLQYFTNKKVQTMRDSVNNGFHLIHGNERLFDAHYYPENKKVLLFPLATLQARNYSEDLGSKLIAINRELQMKEDIDLKIYHNETGDNGGTLDLGEYFKL